MTGDWMPRCRAARRLGNLTDWEVGALVDVGVLEQQDVCGDHLSISGESVRTLLSITARVRRGPKLPAHIEDEYERSKGDL